MRRPTVPRFRPAAAGTAEAGQPERDLAEQGGDLVGAVILDLTLMRWTSPRFRRGSAI